MLASLFKRARPAGAPGSERAGPQVPADSVVWAVGDVHGRLDLLDALLSSILADLAASAAAQKTIVFLGDYVDRGPDSRKVIDRLCWLQDQPGIKARFLSGNHENRLLAFLDDPEVGPSWCDYGGREALLSYGVEVPRLKTGGEAWRDCAARFRDAFPARHRRFMTELEFSLTLGDYFFSHAGARPGVPLDRQSPDDLMWIRQEFLSHRAPFEQVVVHGHTPSEQVEADHRRIGIDTGAYATGVLTGLRLEGADRRLMRAVKTGAAVQTAWAPLN